MNEEKTISKEKFYSVLESLISYNAETEDVYFLSLGFYKKKDYEVLTSITNSELLFSKSLFPILLRPLSILIGSHIGFIRLARNQRVLFELFFASSCTPITLVFLPKGYDVKKFISDFQTREKRKKLDGNYKSIIFEELDEDEITYFTHFDELEILARNSVARPIDLSLAESFETEAENDNSEVSFIDLGIIFFIVLFMTTLTVFSLKERENSRKRSRSYENYRLTPVDTSYLESILEGKNK